MKQTKEADLKSQEEFLKAQEEDSPAAPQGAHSQRADRTLHNQSGPSQQPMDDVRTIMLGSSGLTYCP